MKKRPTRLPVRSSIPITLNTRVPARLAFGRWCAGILKKVHFPRAFTGEYVPWPGYGLNLTNATNDTFPDPYENWVEPNVTANITYGNGTASCGGTGNGERCVFPCKPG